MNDVVLVTDNEFQPPVDMDVEVSAVLPKACMLVVLEMVCSGCVISCIFTFYKRFFPHVREKLAHKGTTFF